MTVETILELAYVVQKALPSKKKRKCKLRLCFGVTCYTVLAYILELKDCIFIFYLGYFLDSCHLKMHDCSC